MGGGHGAKRGQKKKGTKPGWKQKQRGGKGKGRIGKEEGKPDCWERELRLRPRGRGWSHSTKNDAREEPVGSRRATYRETEWKRTRVTGAQKSILVQQRAGGRRKIIYNHKGTSKGGGKKE